VLKATNTTPERESSFAFTLQLREGEIGESGKSERQERVRMRETER